MVCKEKLSIWFKNLSPHKRIDFMCGMLHMCLPMELRFMGSYVEDLARKDFHLLRDSETKANSRYELLNFSEKDSKVFRTKMAVNLALLHSSNRTCSNIIFELLEDNIKDAFTVMDDMDELTIHNILLVLSMAMHHPAFSYHQKSKMFDYYKIANEATTKILKTENDTKLFSSETRQYDKPSQAFSSCPPEHPNYNCPPVTNKVHVCNIEVKGVQPRGVEKKSAEYRLKVTWSNGEETEVFKTYQELEDFHNILLKKIPEDVPVEARLQTQSFSFPVIKGLVYQDKETLVLLNEYTKSLTKLPEHIRQCHFVLGFFGAQAAPRVQMSDASTSPRPQSATDFQDNTRNISYSGDDDTLIHPYLNKPVYNTYLHQSPTQDVCTLSPWNPPPISLDVHDGLAHSPSCSSKMTSPLISSPCRSSASSMESPPLSHPNSPILQEREAHRLPPVISCISKYGKSPCQDVADQVGTLRLEEADDQEPKDMNGALAAAPSGPDVGGHGFDIKTREKLVPGHIANGLIEHPPMMWHQAMSHVPIPCIPHGMATYPYPPPMQPVYGYPVYPTNTSSSTVCDYSPTHSANSSPSPDPLSSSEESEKDKHGNRTTVNGKSKGGAVNLGMCKSGRYVKAAEDTGGYLAVTENCNSSQQGNSGYASDPTYNAPRPQLIRPSYKAQPAHTNMNMGQKMYISMPDNNFKPGASVIPLGIPHHLNLTQSGNAALSDGFQRHFVHLVPGGATMMNRNYPVSMVNNSRQMFSNGLLQSNPTLNHSPSASSLSQNSGNNSSNSTKMYSVSSVVPPITQSQGMSQTGLLRNDSDTILGTQVQQSPKPGNVDVCSLRTGTSSSVPSTSINTSAAYQSQTSTNTTDGCRHCGCSGSHNHISSSQHPPHHAFTFSGLHQVAPGMLPSFPNGVVHMPSPMFQYHNGLQQELLYNMQYGLGSSHTNQQAVPSPAMYGMYGYSSYNAPAEHAHPGAYPKKVTKNNCHNCGSSKHIAAECNEISMEAMAGHPMYSYKPRSDSE